MWKQRVIWLCLVVTGTMRKLPIIAVALLLVTAGCMGVGLDGASYSAPPAEVQNGVAEENEYNVTAVEQFEFNETVNLSEDRDYRIQASNWITTYQKVGQFETTVNGQDISTESISMFAVVSTPSVEIAGQELNPLTEAPMDELLQRMTSQNENVEVHGKVGETTVVHEETGQNVTVEKYNATLRSPEANMEIDAYVHSAVVKTSDGVLVTIGIYPVQLDEEEAIHSMIENVNTTETAPEVEDGGNSSAEN